MRLSKLIEGLGLTRAEGGGDVEIADLHDDSRRVTAGSAFIARGGSTADGRTFIADAVRRGAAAIVTDDAGMALRHDALAAASVSPSADRPVWVVGKAIDQALAGRLAERFFDNPSTKLKLVGVTGTSGKTTTAYLVQQLLQAVGIRCGMIGTVVIDDGQTRTPAALTTPGAIDFSRHLAAMVAHGCAAAVAELSSHALHQGRTAALALDVGVFTNLTGDHLDYHQTLEAYADAKAILFAALPAAPDGFAVVNLDDAWVDRMTARCQARVVGCTLEPSRQIGESVQPAKATILELAASFSRVVMEGPWGNVEVKLPLAGKHNVINALEALAAACCVADASPGVWRGALERGTAPPGRLEPVNIDAPAQALAALPEVLVDYAHKTDALVNVLTALRPVTRGRLIVMFGCGGDRDRTKRPQMAQAACRLADVVVITSDNPRTEDPQAIIREILTGVPRIAASPQAKASEPKSSAALGSTLTKPVSPVIVQPDRAAAIAQTIAMAGPGDVVLLAGKGHEDYQIIGTTKKHFDDREEAAKALRQRVAQGCV